MPRNLCAPFAGTSINSALLARRSLIAGTLATLPLALGGCAPALDLFMDRLSEGYGAPRPAKSNPLADRVVIVAGPLAVIPGPQSVFASADRRYLLDGLAARLRRRFAQVVVAESSRGASVAGSSTVLQLDTTRDSSDAHPAVVHVVAQVYDSSHSLQSVIRGPAVAVDLKRPDRKESIDELLAGLDAKLDILLRQ
jgi:hypothetical protein